MIARRIAAQLAVAGALLCALPQSRDDSKSAATPEIHGVLLEFGTLQPITGAEVSYWTMPAPGRPMSFPEDKRLGKTTTDGAGVFRFLPGENGDYYVLARKEGYGRAPSAGLSMAASIRLTEERPVREIELMLARPGWITGRVVDEDTGRPVAKLRLFATESRYTNGRRMLIAASASATDAEGRFTAAVAPAEYLVELNPRVAAGGPSPLLTTFSEDDLRKVDMGYGETYWPGGHEASTALPVMVGSHDRLDLGTLRISEDSLVSRPLFFSASRLPRGRRDIRISFERRAGRNAGTRAGPLRQRPPGARLRPRELPGGVRDWARPERPPDRESHTARGR